MTLAGWRLWAAVGGAALAGVGAGTFAGGWRQARGLPPMEAAADAGARVQLDAGVAARSDCTVEVTHWYPVEVPVRGPTRYLPAPDGGVAVAQPPQVVTILVPDVRLTGTGAAEAGVQGAASAEGGAGARVAPGAAERPWSASALVSYVPRGPVAQVDGTYRPGGGWAVGAEVARDVGPFVLGVGVLVPPSDPGAVAVVGRVGLRW